MRAAAILAFALFVTACASVAPVPIRAGDVCFHCRQTVTDATLAAEVISPQGMAFKFNSIMCLKDYLDEHPTEEVKAIFVADHEKGRLVRAENAWFVLYPDPQQHGAPSYAAFLSKKTAQQFADTYQHELTDWEKISAAHGAMAH